MRISSKLQCFLASFSIIISIVERCNALTSPAIIDDHLSATAAIPLPAGVTGPESLAFDPDGEGPYTGVSDGRILKWQGEELGWMEYAVVTPQHLGSQEVKKEHICGRPLGLQFNKMTRDLYIADAYFGLMIVSEGDKFAKQIVTQAQNTPLKFTNGLDIDQDTGIVYFTDSSARFQRRENILIEISGDKTGRVLSYNPQNKAVRVLLNGLSYPNGVALSKDGSFLLIAETSTCRILRYRLQPNKDKRAQVLTQLPGYPDNVKPSPRGGFWVAHYERKSKFMEWVMSLPTWVREYIILLPLDVITKIFYKFSEWHGEPLAMRVSGEGEVLELLEDFGGEIVKYISEVEEHNATLWIGSVVMPHVGIYKL
ncbi:protein STRICTOSIDINE SYNTHASE-LIKE 10-like isoform X2 [Asparagus officinalis]|uniref:protein STRICTOSIDINE SYNTHASE-LIKE 10-like isoform X2 n=1 Tax=Asparagus officinalis TaxID=4686 RepID=UPI00098DEF10|nr:protein STRICTOSIDINE SYNTHASE-LIKE 10-like isoform X2 [Asparagus officinalis]